MTETHSVLNQTPPMPGRDVFSQDTALREAVAAFGGESAVPGLSTVGQAAGEPIWRERGLEANRDLPRLQTHDRYGNRVDEVAFNPAWHELMRFSVEHQMHAAPWASTDKAAHLERAGKFVIWTQVEPGHLCPISMTYAAIPALRSDPDVDTSWIDGLSASSYDFGLSNPAEKAGLIAGMTMTEKQGGSDVRQNTTTATRQSDGTYLITGHKWFCSAPMSDVFLILAQAPDGLTCFIIPRVLPDGTRNVFRIQRLKEKLGNKSNASSEIEFAGTVGLRLGPEGRGVRTIVEMVSATRLDTVLGATGLMRGSLSQAIWHAEHRVAFGAPLIDKPLMCNVLADLALETEAATWLAMRLASAVDAAEQGDEGARLLRRIALPAAKYYTTKRSISVTAEALECLGGNGYAEESGMPLNYREAPVNSVWEGSGSVNALDLLRAITREPASLDALISELGAARGASSEYDAAVEALLGEFGDITDLEYRARRLAERVAILLQASLLLRYSPSAVADAFVASRVAGDSGIHYGSLPRSVDTQEIIERARPVK